jgi:catabolite regulation protein CreA
MRKKICFASVAVLILLFAAGAADQAVKVGDDALGTRKYDDFQKPTLCGTSCHVDFYQQGSTVLYPPLE